MTLTKTITKQYLNAKEWLLGIFSNQIISTLCKQTGPPDVMEPQHIAHLTVNHAS